VIVADTKLIAYLLIPSEHTAGAQAVLRKDASWAAPLLWRSEFRNVLSLYVRTTHLSLGNAIDYMQHAESLLATREYEVPSAAVLRLADGSDCAAYDCEFVHLARELGTPLVTSDRRLLRAFPGTAFSMEGFVSR
jgi:predicted nucleic acid-binding protein